MAEKIYYDLSNDKAYRENLSQISNRNLPENIFDTSVDFQLQLLNSMTLTAGIPQDVYIGFVGKTISARAVVDNNFNHTPNAKLAVALSNGVPVSTITIKEPDSDFDPERPAGRINLSSTVTVNYNAITASGDNYILQTADTDFVTDNFTPAADYAIDLVITMVELPLITDSVVDVTDKDTGLFLFTNDTANVIFQAKLDGLEELESCLQEISFIESGDAILRKRFSVGCFGAIDFQGPNAPPVDGDWYNITEIDSLLAEKSDVSQFASAIDFKVAQENTVYTVPASKLFKPDIGDIVTTAITGAATPPTYKWLADSTDLMSASVATMNEVGEYESDGLNAQKYWPAGTVFKMEVTSAGTSTTHTGQAILNGTLIDA